jgi:hypothetical protein
MLIKPPDNVKVHEAPGGILWIKDNVLYFCGKKIDRVQTAEENEEELQLLQKMVGSKKMCMILDLTYAKPPAKGERDKAAGEMEKLVKAMALVGSSPLGRMVANLFFGLKPPTYPVKMFSNVKDAEEWIRKYV